MFTQMNQLYTWISQDKRTGARTLCVRSTADRTSQFVNEAESWMKFVNPPDDLSVLWLDPGHKDLFKFTPTISLWVQFFPLRLLNQQIINCHNKRPSAVSHVRFMSEGSTRWKSINNLSGPKTEWLSHRWASRVVHNLKITPAGDRRRHWNSVK